MSLRIFSAGFYALALAGCDGGASPKPEGNTIDCAIGPGADYSGVCTLERVGEGSEFLIHHPDGGFRRIAVDSETGSLGAVDGADQLMDSSLDPAQAREFAIGEDRYVVPADMLTGGL